MRIEVRPVPGGAGSWGVWVSAPNVEEFLVGRSKHSYECDLAAEKLAGHGLAALGSLYAAPDGPEEDAAKRLFERAALNTLLYKAATVVEHFPAERGALAAGPRGRRGAGSRFPTNPRTL